MTQYLSRRERRDAEKSGIPEELTTPPVSETSFAPAVELTPIEVPVPAVTSLQNEALDSIEAVVKVNAPSESSSPTFSSAAAPVLSRRALREAEKAGKPLVAAVENKYEPAVAPQVNEFAERVDLEPILPAPLEIDLSQPDETVTFTGTNLLAEPSTQSIVLEVVPEAVSLPIEVTGEIVSTGSIAVIPDTTAAIVTATMDGSQLDQVAMKDAVTGVISVVEPVSALTVISERENVGVVPEETLRKGWWIKWLIGIGAVVMTAAAVWATLTILELIGN